MLWRTAQEGATGRWQIFLILPATSTSPTDPGLFNLFSPPVAHDISPTVHFPQALSDHDPQRTAQGRSRPTPIRAPPGQRIQPPDPPLVARGLRTLYPALLLGCRPAAPTRRSLIRHVLPGTRTPRPGGAHRARARLGVQENPQLPRRARSRAPGAEIHLHLYRRLCVLRFPFGPRVHRLFIFLFYLFSLFRSK